MRAPNRFKVLNFAWMFFLMIAFGVPCARAAATDANSPAISANTNAVTNAVSDAEGKAAESTLIGNQESLRSNLQIQEQLHDTLLAIEKSRQEAEVAAARNAELLEARLSLMEKTLAQQRGDELREIEHSDRMMVIGAGAFAAVGFLVLLAAAILQWTGANRLVTLAASLPANHAAPMLGSGETHLLASQALEQANARFLSIIESLEQRIHSMELTGPTPHHLPETSTANGDTTNGAVALTEPEATPSGDTEKGEAVRLLLAKGQTLLKLDQPQSALECFDEVLALDGAHADALVKKGAALERLQRLDEAIECYDLALARDNSMTMAYLYKGGVFNRLERYTEALACYEQALKSQQKGHAANVIMD
jgi:tetratricopeptide (TPR) repeat protein